MANHVSHAALPYPIKGARYTILIPYLDADGDPTDPTTPDTEFSLDGGAYADCAEEMTTISGSNGTGYITVTGAETNGSLLALTAKVASGPKATIGTYYPRVLASVGTGTLSAGSAGGGTLGTILAYDVTGCFIKTTGGTGGGGTGGASNQARKIVTYNTSTGAFTVEPNWETTPSTDTTYSVLLPEGVTLGMLKTLNPTTPGNTLDVNSGGEAGVDWGNVGNKTTTNAFTGTTIASTQKVDVETIKTQTVTCAAGVTVSPYVGSTGAAVNGTNVNTLSSHDPGATLGTSTLTQTQVTGGAYALNSASFAFNAALDFTTTQKAATLARVTLTDTVTTYTGNTPQTGDSFARIGLAGAGLTSLGDTRIANLDATVSSRGTSTLTQTQVTGGAYALNSASFAFDAAVPLTTQQKADVAASAVASVTGNVGGNVVGSVGSVAGAVGSVTGNVGGNVVGSVGSVAANGIAAATFAADVDAEILSYLVDDATRIDASALNTAAGTTIPAILVDTGTTLDGKLDAIQGATFNTLTDSLEAIRDRGDAAWTTATGFSTLDAAGVRAAVGLGAANLDTQLSTIDTVVDSILVDTAEIGAAGAGLTALATQASVNTVASYIDTEVAAIKAKTDNLPASPASEATLVTIASYIDTEVAAIKAKTDQLTFTVANQVDSNALSGGGAGGGLTAAEVRAAVGLAAANLDTQLAAIDDFLDTEIAAIKAKTDNLPASPANEATLATIASYIDTEVAAIKAKTDNLPASPASEATLVTIAGYIDTEVAAIKAKTDNLPASPANEATLTTIASYIDTEVAAIKVVTDKLSDTLEDSGGGNWIFTAAALENSTASAGEVTASQVWAYAGADPSSAPTATASMAAKVNWLFALERNKRTQTESTQTLRNAADSADIATRSLSDDGTTFTVGGWV